MAETETDKQHADGADQTVEDDTSTSQNNGGAENGNDDDAGADDNKGDDSNDKDEDGADDDKSTSKDKDATDDDADAEPPVRQKPVSAFIKARQEKKAQRDAGKKDDAEDDADGEDDDIADADKEVIDKRIQAHLKPLIDKEEKEHDDREVNDFLKENPDFKPYEAKARKYMSHPSRKNVPIKEIFYGVAGPDLMKIGAKRATIANNKAKQSKSGGGSTETTAPKSNANLTKDELSAKQAEVRAKLADR